MLKSLTLENFKVLPRAEVDFGKISVLIGPNRSGKSSMLHALAFLKQSALQGGLASNGPVIDLGPPRDLVFRRGMNTPVSLALTRDVNRTVARVIPEGGLLSYKLEFYGTGDWHQNLAVQQNGQEVWRVMSGTGLSETAVKLHLLDGEGEIVLQGGNEPARPIRGVSPNLPDPPFDYRARSIIARELQEFLDGAIRDFWLVPALRGLTETEYKSVDLAQEDVKHSWQLPDTMAGSPDVAETARAWTAEVLGAGARVRRPRQGTWLVESISGSHTFNIVNEGTGLNQLTHLLFVVAAAPSGSVVGIEEPELHLHPAGQARLAELFVRLVTETGGPQLILTTHSEHLALELLIAVAEKRLRPEDLSLYYFERDGDSGLASRLEINEFGQVQGGLPGFFEPEVDQLGKYLAALSKK